jgi:hypothetical protein
MNEFCRTQQRGSQAVCQGMRRGHEGEHNFVLPEGAPAPKKIEKRWDARTIRVARMLSILLDESQDDAANPAEVRLEQASQLLSNWYDAQSLLIGSFYELIKLKIGYCVRCPDVPCTICGYDGSVIV